MDDKGLKKEIKLPYLMQRMRVSKEVRTGKTGVDAFIEFDYMGSAEFEFGALGKTLKQSRAQVQSEPLQLLFNGHEAWFVGPEEKLEVADAWFRDQLTDQKCRMKESSRLKMSYGVDDGMSYPARYKPEPFDGWWAIVTSMTNPLPSEQPWVIFRKKEYAQKWREALVNKK